jgi:NOL1/NOP2/fmu family ribosome biogenesis protein
MVCGERAYLVPPELPEALAAAALAPGLLLAERRGRTWRPAHALAMALRPSQAGAAIFLDDEKMLLFLAGQPFAAAAGDNGVALAVWRGYPLGWGRARGGTLAPLLPAGQRSRYV